MIEVMRKDVKCGTLVGRICARRAKTALLKQGMMQELLTGKVRLL